MKPDKQLELLTFPVYMTVALLKMHILIRNYELSEFLKGGINVSPIREKAAEQMAPFPFRHTIRYVRPTVRCIAITT